MSPPLPTPASIDLSRICSGNCVHLQPSLVGMAPQAPSTPELGFLRTMTAEFISQSCRGIDHQKTQIARRSWGADDFWETPGTLVTVLTWSLLSKRKIPFPIVPSDGVMHACGHDGHNKTPWGQQTTQSTETLPELCSSFNLLKKVQGGSH